MSEEVIEKENKSGPPAPRLVAGQLLKDELEITALVFSDAYKNVYKAQEGKKNYLVVECYDDGRPFLPLPEPCVPMMPPLVDHFEQKDRVYAVFREMQANPLLQAEIPCWEPFLVRLLMNLGQCLETLDQNGLDLTSVDLADLFVNGLEVRLLVYPRAKEANRVDEVFFQSVHSLLFHCLLPRSTRNLEKPLDCLSLSDSLQRAISSYLNEESGAQTFMDSLRARLEEREPYWDIQSVTDKGMIRDSNEDACGWLSSEIHTFRKQHHCHLLAVSDGMGGHHMGELASHHSLIMLFQKLMGKVLFRPSEELENPHLREVIEESFDEVAEELHQQKEFTEGSWQHGRTRPGATLVAALLVGRLAFLGNCGDSRAYVIERSGIRRLTIDHSVVQLYVDRGQISEEEAFNHEQGNLITSFMGTEKRNYRRDTFVYYMPPGSRLLLCCDGLSDMLREQEIFQIVSGCTNAGEACRLLVKSANERGGDDNISVVIAMDHGPEGKPESPLAVPEPADPQKPLPEGVEKTDGKPKTKSEKKRTAGRKG